MLFFRTDGCETVPIFDTVEEEPAPEEDAEIELVFSTDDGKTVLAGTMLVFAETGDIETFEPIIDNLAAVGVAFFGLDLDGSTDRPADSADTVIVLRDLLDCDGLFLFSSFTFAV